MRSRALLSHIVYLVAFSSILDLHRRSNERRVISEVVGDCRMLLEDGALQPRRLSKKRKIVDGLFGKMYPSQVAVLKDSRR